MGWPEAVVAIIIIVTVGRVLRTKYRSQHGILEDKEVNAIAHQPTHDPDANRLREEVTYLKDRVAVLEKIATEDRGARELEDEIEKLRDR